MVKGDEAGDVLLIYREDRLSISHTLSPPPFASVCDESNDGEYGLILTAIVPHN